MLYGRKGPVQRGVVAEIGKARVVREGADVTIVATLLMVERSLAAAETLAAEGIGAEVIDLRWVRPLDHGHDRGVGRARPVAWSSPRSSGTKPAGARRSSAKLAQTRIPWKASPTAVSLPYDLLIPYSPPLEDEFIPSADQIAAAARTAVGR